MGLQSGSERTSQDVLLRRVSNEKFLEAARLIKHYDISGYYDVILDNPFKTDADLIETINVLKKLPRPLPAAAVLFNLLQGYRYF